MQVALALFKLCQEKLLVTEDMGVIRFAELVRRTLNERYPGMPIAKITGDPAGEGRMPVGP